MKSILLSLVMPPTGFLTLIIAGLLLYGRWSRVGRRLAWLGVAGLLLSSLPIVSHTALVALEQGLPTAPTAANPPRAIIVLGAEVMRDAQDPLGTRAGLLTLDRLRAAAALQRRTGLPILVSGGTTQADAAPVAVVMDRSLREDFRTPVRWIEARSADTWENARFSADILRAEDITSVYVVTHAWHMKRALLAFEGTGLTVTAAPTPVDALGQPDIADCLPHVSAWQSGYYALHEWIGLLWYRLR